MNFNISNLSNPTVMLAAAVVIALLAIAVAVAVYEHKKRTALLRSRFGPEYDLAVGAGKNSRAAEDKLVARVKRVRNLRILDLTEAERARFLASWETIQSRFVDHPRSAVTEADQLVNSLLQARGFPAADFEQRAADISVDHANLVAAYRSAHEITSRSDKNNATTEELRNAMLHYRALFDEFLQNQKPAETRAVA
jgi:hypothetical protein